MHDLAQLRPLSYSNSGEIHSEHDTYKIPKRLYMIITAVLRVPVPAELFTIPNCLMMKLKREHKYGTRMVMNGLIYSPATKW